MFEDIEVRVVRAPTLDLLSIDEIEAKIAALKAEIILCEAEIERKRAQKSAAEALFGNGD